MLAWRCDDVSAIGADVHSGPQVYRVLDPAAGVLEQVVSAPSSGDCGECVERPVSLDLFVQGVESSFVPVNVEDDDARIRPGGDGQIRPRPFLSPCRNLLAVIRRILDSVLCAWVFTGATAVAPA